MISPIGLSLKVSVILGIALVVVQLLRKQSAALRHWVLAAAMLCAALAPVLNMIVPALDVTLKTRIKWLATEPAPKPNFMAAADFANMVPATLEAGAHPNSHSSSSNRTAESERNKTEASTEIALLPSTQPRPNPVSAGPAPSVAIERTLKWLWIAGVFFGFVGMISGIVRLAWISSNSERVLDDTWSNLSARISSDYRLPRPLRILRTRQPSLLATWGIFWPEVLLPATSADWTAARIDVVISHELAHVRRGDWLIQVLSQMVRAFYWFNPLVWIVCRRLNYESEHACDDAVINRGIAATDYAAHLLSLARTLDDSGRAWTPAPMMARESTFKRRFKALLNPRLNRSGLTRIAILATVVVLMAITFPIVALRVSGQSASSLTGAITKVSGVETLQAAFTALLPQIQTPQIAPPQPGTSSIEGVVVKLETNEPIAGVDVELTRVEGTAAYPLLPPAYPPGNFSRGAVVRPSAPNPADVFNLRTKDDGRFSVSDLKPGTYQLRTARFGGAYFPAEYGQRDPRGRGHVFTLSEGQSLKNLKIEMAPTGSITGHVSDTDGVPGARVRVMALEASYETGRRVLNLVQAQDTDDRGDYRLFWLPPGRYFIAARSEDLRAQNLSMAITPPGGATSLRESFSAAAITPRSAGSGEIIEETYQLIYYGSGTDAQHATAIDLHPGANVAGIDVYVGTGHVPARRVRGVVIDGTTGKPVAGASVQAYPQQRGPSDVLPRATADTNGAFELTGLLPIAYDLNANTGDYKLRGDIPLEAGPTNSTNLTITLTAGFSLQGRITVEGRPRTSGEFDFSALRVNFGPSICCATPAPTGAFVLNDVRPGHYNIGIGPILTAIRQIVNVDIVPGGTPPGLQDVYVKSIELGGLDVFANGLRITGPTSQELQVVIDVNGGSTEGRVVDTRQQPVVNATIVLVPDIARRNRKDLFRSATTDSEGHFKFRAVPPGDYRLLAWNYVENGIWFEEDFLRGYENRGLAVRIRGGENPTIDVQVIPR